jgi:hypothetical protein
MPNLPHITRFGLPGIDRRPVQAHASLRVGASAYEVAGVRGLSVSGHRRRRLAEEDPDIAAELRYVAQQLQAEAEDLTRRDTE